MPWINEPGSHACALPKEIRHNARWYCGACGQVWKTELRPPAYDFLRDRPMTAIWMYVRVKGEFIV